MMAGAEETARGRREVDPPRAGGVTASLTTDRHGVILCADAAAEELLRLPCSWILGKPLAVFVPLALRRSFRHSLAEALRGTASSQWSLRLQPRAGEPFDASMSVEPARGEGGPVNRLQWRIDAREAPEPVRRGAAPGKEPHDGRSAPAGGGDTPRRAGTVAIAQPPSGLAPELPATLTDLPGARPPMDTVHEARLRLVGEMAAALVHELTQPISAIGALAHGLERRMEKGDVSPETLRGALSQLRRQVERAGTLVRHTRGLACTSTPERTLGSLDDIVRSTLELAEVITREIPAVSIEHQPGLPAVRLDPVQIEQVILNLIHNAVVSMRGVPQAARALRVLTQRSRDGATVRVQDTGVGFEGEPERLFHTWFTTRANGTGLGLAICREIVQDHGGFIWARPLPGAGAEFGFTLPPAATEGS